MAPPAAYPPPPGLYRRLTARPRRSPLPQPPHGAYPPYGPPGAAQPPFSSPQPGAETTAQRLTPVTQPAVFSKAVLNESVCLAYTLFSYPYPYLYLYPYPFFIGLFWVALAFGCERFHWVVWFVCLLWLASGLRWLFPTQDNRRIPNSDTSTAIKGQHTRLTVRHETGCHPHLHFVILSLSGFLFTIGCAGFLGLRVGCARFSAAQSTGANPAAISAARRIRAFCSVDVCRFFRQ